MERKINWISGYLDEIELVYDKAEENAEIAELLSEFEEGALAEAKMQCGAFKIETDGKPVGPQQFDSVPDEIKETVIARLSDLGIGSFNAPLTKPTIEIYLSPAARLVFCCTAFSILNRLEKLDGAINVLHPKMTLKIEAPLGCKRMIQLQTLLVQLYPWLEKVKEISYGSAAPAQKTRTDAPAAAQNKAGGQNKSAEVNKKSDYSNNYNKSAEKLKDYQQPGSTPPKAAAPQQKPAQSTPAAAPDKSGAGDSKPGFFARLFGGKDKGAQKAPAKTPPPAAKEKNGTNAEAAANASPYAAFYLEMKSKPPFLTAVGKANTELERIISQKLLGLKSPTGGDLTLAKWKALPEAERMQYILAVGAHGITPSALLCIDFAEVIPNCLALTLLYYAFTGAIENQLLDTGAGTDATSLKAVLESLKGCCPKWSYKILT